MKAVYEMRQNDRTSIKRYSRIAAAILLALLVLMFAGWQLLVSDYARGKISAAVSDRLGRAVSIEGPLHVDWHWTAPRFSVNHLRVANMPDGDAPYMADIGRIELRVKIWKLLAGRLDLPEIRITEPRISLERKDEDNKNWDFPALSGANVAKNAVVPDDRHDMPIIGALRISGGALSFKDKPRGIDVAMQVDTARGKSDKSDEIFVFTGKGTIEEQPFTLSAEGGSLELLRDTRKSFPLAMNLSIGDSSFSVDGTFTDPIKMTGLDAALHLKGTNLADLFYLMHIPFPPTPPYELKGQLSKKGDKWTFNPFTGTVGGSDLSGDVVYDAEGERPLLTGTLHSKRLDVADLGGFVGLSPEPVKKSAKKDKNAKVLPDTQLDIKRLRAGDMDLTFTAEKLNAPGWPLSDMNTHIVLKDGLLDMKPLRFGMASGSVQGFLTLDGRQEIPGVSMDLGLQNLSLKRFFSGSKFADFSKGTFSGRIQLAGTGPSLSKVLGNSNGRMAVTMTGGKISLLLIEATDLDISQIVPLFFGKDKTTDIRCGVADFGVRNGLLTSRTFVLDTDDTNLKGKAEINFKNEKMDIALDAQPKDASLLALQSKILVRGTLGNPTIMLDPVSTAARGIGAALLGIVAPVAAILPFIQWGNGEDNDCAALLAQTQNPLPAKKPARKAAPHSKR